MSTTNRLEPMEILTHKTNCVGNEFISNKFERCMHTIKLSKNERIIRKLVLMHSTQNSNKLQRY